MYIYMYIYIYIYITQERLDVGHGSEQHFL